jgi:hypothetical protein
MSIEDRTPTEQDNAEQIRVDDLSEKAVSREAAEQVRGGTGTTTTTTGKVHMSDIPVMKTTDTASAG